MPVQCPLKTLKDLTKEYEKLFFNWKKSGNHGSFGDILEGRGKKDNEEQGTGDDFQKISKTNLSMLYMHQYVRQFPEILEKVAGELLGDILREKSQKEASNNQQKRTTKPGRKKG